MGERGTSSPESLFNNEYIEITDGLPFASGQDLYLFIVHQVEVNARTRFPILGVRDESGKIRSYLLLSDKEQNRSTHAALNKKLGNPIENGKLVYATSLDGLKSSQPNSTDPSLKLPNVKHPEYGEIELTFIPLTKQSDFVDFNGSDFNPTGKAEIKRIFSIPGVEFFGEW